jgi:hypothetical protein
VVRGDRCRLLDVCFRCCESRLEEDQLATICLQRAAKAAKAANLEYEFKCSLDAPHFVTKK